MSDIWEGENKESRGKELANDLLALQIDLILKPKILGERMPSPRMALCQIAEIYLSSLKKWRVVKEDDIDVFCRKEIKETLKGLTPVLKELGPEEEKSFKNRILNDDRSHIPGGRDAFQFISERINNTLSDTEKKGDFFTTTEKLKPHEQELRISLLERMLSNSIEIVDILDSCDRDYNKDRIKEDTIRQNPIECNDGLTASLIRMLSNKRKNNKRIPLEPLRLTRKQYSRIQKIWEIGLEEIVMQTVVQIDGDVTTRVVPRYASSDHHFLYQIHRDSVSVSMRYWKDLVKVLAAFFESIWKLIFKG
jgi:hypothetical protein